MSLPVSQQSYRHSSPPRYRSPPSNLSARSCERMTPGSPERGGSVMRLPKSPRAAPEPSQVVHLVLIRHGETASTANRMIEGHSDGEVNERGRQQATLLGKRLAKEHFASVYSSDFKRARQTAEEIKRYQPPEHSKQFKAILCPELRERNAGEFEGHPYGSVDAAARAAGEPPREFHPRWGESWEDVRMRADEFLQRVVKSHLPPPPGGNFAMRHAQSQGGKRVKDHKSILIVTHGGFVKEWIDVVSHYGGGGLVRNAAQLHGPRWATVGQSSAGTGGSSHYPDVAKNTGVFRFNMFWANGRLNVNMVAENDVSHLRGMARDFI